MVILCDMNISDFVLCFAGCTLIDSVPPCAHVFTHYGDCARKFGVLCWYMLMAFERYNKKIKGLVGNATHPVASLKAALLRDAGNYYIMHTNHHSPFIYIISVTICVCVVLCDSGIFPTMARTPGALRRGQARMESTHNQRGSEVSNANPLGNKLAS